MVVYIYIRFVHNTSYHVPTRSLVLNLQKLKSYTELHASHTTFICSMCHCHVSLPCLQEIKCITNQFQAPQIAVSCPYKDKLPRNTNSFGQSTDARGLTSVHLFVQSRVFFSEVIFFDNINLCKQKPTPFKLMLIQPCENISVYVDALRRKHDMLAHTY